MRRITRILGIDLSLNHAGIVCLEATPNKETVSVQYVSDKKGSADRSPSGTYFRPIKGFDPDFSNVLRLAWWKLYLEKAITRMCPDYVGIEGYSYNSKTNSGYQIGELGGTARLAVWGLGACLRIHDPLSIKLFATGKGTSKPDDLFEILPDFYKTEFSKLDSPKGRAKKQNTQTSRDLAVAYWVAQLVWSEVKLRKGNLALNNLSPSQIKVFNRVTKKNPTNLLARDWIQP